MYCSNCEKESNLTLCKQCQKEFQEIEDEMKKDNLYAQDQAEYESERYYCDGEREVNYAKEYAALRRDEAMEMNRDMDELYERELDRWYAENGY